MQNDTLPPGITEWDIDSQFDPDEDPLQDVKDRTISKEQFDEWCSEVK